MQPILKVDLSTRKIESFNVHDDWVKDYLGGASLGARILYDLLSRELDPFSPESPLLFINGPLTGTLGPAVGRFVVCGKSPATGLWAESNCGGFWGPELRFAGYDGLLLIGKSEKPEYLTILDDEIDFKPADHLWGLDTYEIQTRIKTEIDQPKAKVLAIGPAGENKVLFSGLFCDHGRTAGRTGLGAVMGSKLLKAIVVKGSEKIPVDQPENYNKVRSQSNRFLKDDIYTKVFHDLGTASAADYSDYLGIMPKKYYSQGLFEDVGKISGSKISETILVGTKACHGCVIACGRVVDLGDGQHRKGPEYETIVGFGPNLLNSDIASIVKLGELCDLYGLDTISTGNILGLAYKMYADGVIDKQDTGGLDLSWGKTKGAMDMIPLIAKRQGIGDIMANGSREFAKVFGIEGDAVQINGLEVPYHDPRGASGMALVYATSPRGACHNKSDYFFVDWGQSNEAIGIDYYLRQAGAEKALNVSKHQNYRTVFDALVLCLFSNIPVEMVIELIRFSTGFEYSIDSLMRCGERAWNLKRCINIRLGLKRSNEKLPKALLTPLPDGGAAGYEIPFEEMLNAYYDARQLDKTTGIPIRTKLEELGLHFLADDLYPIK
jgi:aldehyde:ferredoxin oxidoreductase